MAGAGYKLFTTGEVLTAAQVNTYLQEQTVMSFADSAARTTALSGVLAEGMMSYLRDTNAVQVYNGSAWVAVGGSSPLTTKGDLYGFSTVDARIPIGTNNQVLTADSAQALGLKWATPSGALTLAQIATGSFSGTSVTVSSLDTYDTIIIQINGITNATSSTQYFVRINNETTNYRVVGAEISATPAIFGYSTGNVSGIFWTNNFSALYTSTSNRLMIQFSNCKSAGFTSYTANGQYLNDSSVSVKNDFSGIHQTAAAVSSLVFGNQAGNTFNAGTYTVWGG